MSPCRPGRTQTSDPVSQSSFASDSTPCAPAIVPFQSPCVSGNASELGGEGSFRSLLTLLPVRKLLTTRAAARERERGLTKGVYGLGYCWTHWGQSWAVTWHRRTNCIAKNGKSIRYIGLQ